ncbi:MAG: type VI secretion system tube protein Hcp [Phycisphaera sp.]|nr:MAG: type VI secretion system tube protein Hcp [Phycisphaera sp.]
MPFDGFMEVEGIKGDSTDKAHKEWIEILGFQHRIHQPTGGTGSAQGTHAGGRADHADFKITKRLDSATPGLALHCCNGKPIPEVKIELCRAMGDKTKFMQFTLKDAIISEVSPIGRAAGDDSIPVEEVCFRYGEIHWEYTPTDPKGGGKTGAAMQSGWSTLENASA